MSKAKHSWVIEFSKQSQYGRAKQFYSGGVYVGPLSAAELIESRSFARELAYPGERVRKVLLNKAGRPYKVIRRKATV